MANHKPINLDLVGAMQLVIDCEKKLAADPDNLTLKNMMAAWLEGLADQAELMIYALGLDKVGEEFAAQGRAYMAELEQRKKEKKTQDVVRYSRASHNMLNNWAGHGKGGRKKSHYGGPENVRPKHAQSRP